MKRCTPLFSKFAAVTHEFAYDDILKGETKTKFVHHIKHIEAPTMERLRAMAKTEFVRDFKNLAYEEKEIVITLSDGHVDIFKEREYSSDYGIESSKTYKTWTVVRATRNNKIIRTLKLNVRTVLNPKFEDRPECDFCYKKVVSVSDDNLLDDKKTAVKVCKKCKADLKIMRGFVEKRELGISN